MPWDSAGSLGNDFLFLWADSFRVLGLQQLHGGSFPPGLPGLIPAELSGEEERRWEGRCLWASSPPLLTWDLPEAQRKREGGVLLRWWQSRQGAFWVSACQQVWVSARQSLRQTDWNPWPLDSSWCRQLVKEIQGLCKIVDFILYLWGPGRWPMTVEAPVALM